MKKISVVAILILLASAIVLQTISLAWMSDNGMSSPIDITTNVHKSYFASGDGTAEIVKDGEEIISGPYEIATPLQLYYFAWLQYLGFFNVDNDKDGVLDTVYFRLSADLDMDYTNADGVRTQFILPPIGTTDNPFIGNFDGEGHTVTDLTVENYYSSLIDPPEGTNDFSGAEIIGFFGVIGSLPASTYTYDTQANEVKNVVLENLTVKTQTDFALIGLVAGYVNGTVNRVGVVGSEVDIKAGTQALSYTNNMSDFSLIGYCTEAYRDKVYMLNLSLNNPGISDAYNVVPDMTGDGSSPGWGGSVKMLDIYTWLTDVSEDRATANNGYILERTDVVDLSGKTVTLTSSTASKRTYTVENFGSFIITDSQPNYVNFVSGASRVTKFEYVRSEGESVNLYYITDGTYYLTYANGSITSTTNANGATAWYVSGGTSGGNIYTVVDNRVLYLTAGVGGVTVAEASPLALPSWTVSGNTYSLNGMNLVCTNGTWSLSGFRISYNNNYLTNNGTNGITNTNTENNAAVWQIAATEEGYQLYTVINNTTYYLGYTATTSNWGGANVSGPTLSQNPSTWQMSNGQFYFTMTTNNYFGGGTTTTTYYLRWNTGYNNNSWTVSNSTTNATLTLRSTENDTVTIRTSGTTGNKITLKSSQYIDNDLVNGYYDQNGNRVSSGLPGVSYFPLSTSVNVSNNSYQIDVNNTGYIIGAEWGAIEKNEHDTLGNVRIASYDANSMSNYVAPYTITYKTNGKFKTISEIPTDKSKLTEEQVEMLNLLGLSKYADCYGDYRSSITNNCYGIHFMQASVSITNTMRADVYLNGEYISNYEMPTNCIDFNLYDRGFINFVAGSYYVQNPPNDSFFSIYEIVRDPNDRTTITAIKEIYKIYAAKLANDDIDTSKAYYYTYLVDGEEVGEENIPAGYEMVFDCRWITHPDTSSFYGTGDPNDPTAWAQNRAFYFEVPVNGGEYAIGSTEGRTGAYLTYLDLAANAQLIERNKEYEEITENGATAIVPDGVEMLAPSQSGYDISIIDPMNSAFASIGGGTSGTITFDREGNMILHSATSGTTAEYINVGSTLVDGNGNPMSVPWTVTTLHERTTYRDYNLNTGVSTVTVITKTTVTEGAEKTVTYTKVVTTTDPEGNVEKKEYGPQEAELFPETQDADGSPTVSAGGKLIDIALGYGQEDSLEISYLYVPASVDENGATVAAKYIITFKNTDTKNVKIKAILTELGTTSGITFVITDGTTETTLDNSTAEQLVEIAPYAATPEAPENSETPETPETPEGA